MATQGNAVVGTAIKRARERRRWTQQDLADRLGVARRSVDNWENGRSSPRSAIGALEELLGISLDEDATPPAPAGPGAAETEIWNLRGVSDEEKAGLVAWLRARRSVAATGEADAPRAQGE